jgi:hypothetical protein
MEYLGHGTGGVIIANNNVRNPRLCRGFLTNKKRKSMATKTISGATFEDVEQGLVDQWGRNSLRNPVKTDTHAKWTFRWASRGGSGQCNATKTADGVSVSLSYYVLPIVWVLLVVAYVLCIVPGIIMTISLAIKWPAGNVVIGLQFPKFVEAVERAKLARLHSKL